MVPIQLMKRKNTTTAGTSEQKAHVNPSPGPKVAVDDDLLAKLFGEDSD